MKSLLILGVCSLLCVAPNLAAVTYQFIAGDKSAETKICVAAGNDQRGVLRRKLENYSHNVRLSTNLIDCNGMSLTQFSYKYGALKSFDFLNRFTSMKNRVRQSVTIKDIYSYNGADSTHVVVIRVSAK